MEEKGEGVLSGSLSKVIETRTNDKADRRTTGTSIRSVGESGSRGQVPGSPTRRKPIDCDRDSHPPTPNKKTDARGVCECVCSLKNLLHTQDVE